MCAGQRRADCPSAGAEDGRQDKGDGRPGNKNGAKGPRVGRKDKTTEPLPQPRSEATAKFLRRRKREKTPGSGRDFRKGQNSHTGEVFKRGADMLPRGNTTLFYKVLYHDEREALYQRHCRIIRCGSNRDVLELSKIMVRRALAVAGHASPPNVVEEIRLGFLLTTLRDIAGEVPTDALCALARPGEAGRARGSVAAARPSSDGGIFRLRRIRGLEVDDQLELGRLLDG